MIDSPASKNRTKRSAPAISQTSPPAKKGKISDKEQKTITQFMEGGDGDEEAEKQISGNGEAGDDDELSRGLDVEKRASDDAKKESKDESSDKANSDINGLKKDDKNALDEAKADTDDVKTACEKEQENKTDEIPANNGTVVEDSEREAKVPSSILEKGIIYFFFRGRVGVDEPQGIEDVARSYIVLRPLPVGAKLGEGPLPDDGNARILALPKKMLPKSTRDRFLLFVEKTKTSITDLRNQFSSADYPTKMSGTSHTPSAAPFAEGVYCITSTGRDSHLAYQITHPEIGEVQKELGVFKKGSYGLSVKNPSAPGPANATLDNPARYPSSLQDKFRDLRWTPLEPEHLEYKHTQILFIGEGFGNFAHAMDELSKDKKDEKKERPEEEIEGLVGEYEKRTEGLEDDPVFAALGLSGKCEKMETTW
ncbi:hypothetical protein BJ878DRAFT_423168 [Calycina marina]|uniref:Uncharacterized protein n=1 Tax=Calycina marina TaxID=1763456 RepID=A0A9P8CEC2_9HELO|nr:hypothetical protein BJ878DRAFT_423168 [Calycina marina]